jgi:RNA polymerase sigma-70 factor (ECF subfamily)
MDGETDRAFDEYLVLLAKAGSRAAFDRLARRWTPRLKRYVLRKVGVAEVARDIVQETWIGVIHGLARLQNGTSFPAWIYRIAHRKCVDSIRGAQRHRRLTAAAGIEADVSASCLDGAAAFDSADLTSALRRLSSEHRDVVALFYAEDLGVQEIAAVLSVPVGTVKSRLHHARQALKTQLGE